MADKQAMPNFKDMVLTKGLQHASNAAAQHKKAMQERKAELASQLAALDAELAAVDAALAAAVREALTDLDLGAAAGREPPKAAKRARGRKGAGGQGFSELALAEISQGRGETSHLRELAVQRGYVAGTANVCLASLGKAGLIASPGRGRWEITPAGREKLASGRKPPS